MKRKRFGEEQIIGILNEAAAGATAVEVCRRHGVSETTYYRWKAKFGGLAVSDAKRLRQLEAEDSRLKQRGAQGAAGKNVWSAPPRKAENDDRSGFAPMYPASREWAGFPARP